MIWMLVCKVEELPDPKRPESAPSPTSEETVNFYVRLGMAIAAWQFVESQLFNIYVTAFDLQSIRSSYDALNAAFHVPAGFRLRLEMTNAALERAGLPKELKDEWSKLFDRAAKRSKRRNDIAHAIVCFRPYAYPVGRQLFLSPNLANVANRDAALAQDTVIGQKQLDEIRASFEELSTSLEEFMRKMVQLRHGASP